jgi:DNA-directed RNA polymerase subunit RPC12/RpoP
MQQIEGGTAESTPAVQCPSCGSQDVAAIPLSLIEAKYYKCAACVITFRALLKQEPPADIERFNRGWALTDDKPKS